MPDGSEQLGFIDQLLTNLELTLALVFGLGLLALLLMMILERRRDRDVLEDWAVENDFELIDWRRRRWWAQGKLTWSTVSHQRVYHVRVRTRSGSERAGLVRFGPRGWASGGRVYRFGDFSAVDVVWDDEGKIEEMPFRPLSDEEAELMRRNRLHAEAPAEQAVKPGNKTYPNRRRADDLWRVEPPPQRDGNADEDQSP